MKNLIKVLIVALFIGAILISPTLRKEVKNHRLAAFDEGAALETILRKFDEKLKKEPQKITFEIIDEALLSAQKLFLKEKEGEIHTVYCHYFQNRNEKEKLIEHAEKGYALLKSKEEKQNLLLLWIENLILLGEDKIDDLSFFSKARELVNLAEKEEITCIHNIKREVIFNFLLAKLTLLDGSGSLPQAKRSLFFAKENIQDPAYLPAINLYLSELCFLEGDLESSLNFLEEVDSSKAFGAEKLFINAKIYLAKGELLKAQEQIQKAQTLKNLSVLTEKKVKEFCQELQEAKKVSLEGF